MNYLQPAEYELFGLAPDTAEAWITAASSMIDAHCRRPSLMSASYTERMRLSERAHGVQLSYGPLLSVESVRAKYARPSLNDGSMPFSFEDCVASAFGLPGAWVDVDTGTLDICSSTGEIAFGANFLGFRYSEAEVTYTAGFTAIPDAIKVACAQIVKNAQSTPGLNVRSSKMDTLETQYFSDSLLDTQVQAMLRPFVAERLG